MKEIYKKLFVLQNKQIKLKKDADNPFFKSTYITLDNILNIYEPLFTENQLLCIHYSKDNKLITEIIDIETEQKVLSEFNIYNTDPQKQGSEVTYWKRYNLGQLLNIQTDIDDDWNLASSSWNTKEFYKSDKRDLLAVINELKESNNLDEVIKLKEEWKILAKTDKQKEWLKREFDKQKTNLG